jgi:hypothetical protein
MNHADILAAFPKPTPTEQLETRMQLTRLDGADEMR